MMLYLQCQLLSLGQTEVAGSPVYIIEVRLSTRSTDMIRFSRGRVLKEGVAWILQ